MPQECPNISQRKRTWYHRVPPDVGLAPSAAWRAPPPPPPCALGPLPLTSLDCPLPEPCKKSQEGLGKEGRRGRGGKGFGLREGSSNYNGGLGGDPPNTSWGQTHIWGLPIPAPKARLYRKVLVAKCLPGCAEGPCQGRPLSPRCFENVFGTRLESTFECKARLENADRDFPEKKWTPPPVREPPWSTFLKFGLSAGLSGLRSTEASIK